jgi:polar amino acid transport system substrate-binding protein
MINDIADKRVGVFTGTVNDAFVAGKYPQAKIMRYESTADMIMSIKSGKIDVAMLDLITAGILLKNKSNEDLGILTDEALTLPLGIGLNKNNPALRDQFNSYLKAVRADGSYSEMYERWFVNDPEKAVVPDIKKDSVGGKVVLGVAVDDLPYVAFLNGRYEGFDIEMMKRFAAHEGLQLEITTMEFSSLVAALASGKVDMIADGIAITEERSKQINFSDSYVDFRTAVIGLKKNIASYDEQSVVPVTIPLLKNLSDSFYNNIILEDRYLLIVDGLKTTAVISLFAAFFGTLLGALICFLRMSKNKLLNNIAKFYISIMRGTPVLVLLMIVFYVVFASVNINPVIVAILAFGANFEAYVSEMFRTSIALAS